MSERTIDYSRYRVARAICDQWEAGESRLTIVDEYFLGLTGSQALYMVELIVAAHDREGKYEPKVPA